MITLKSVSHSRCFLLVQEVDRQTGRVGSFVSCSPLSPDWLMYWVGPRASEHLESLSLTEETTESRHNIRIARKTQTGLCCSRGLARSWVLNMLHFSFCSRLPWFVDFLSQAVGCELCGCAQHHCFHRAAPFTLCYF